jgi:hypothetical protein
VQENFSELDSLRSWKEDKVWEIIKQDILSMFMDEHAAWIPNAVHTVPVVAPIAMRHKEWMAQILHTINRQGINMPVDIFVVKGDNSQLQDIFVRILHSSRMKQVSKGVLFDKVWGEQIQLNPVAHILVALKFHFEKLAEVANTNLAL